MTIKRKSPTLIDGISAAGLRKIGDSDAAASVKRVPGVSVEGGKYVYVRGLGDRYTKDNSLTEWICRDLTLTGIQSRWIFSHESYRQYYYS
ncbi:MAG: hypothetical protein U5L72_11520 [Bacteroidales bacterium]|nr:hypothetical protein [Bacteroidales bacterium]